MIVRSERELKAEHAQAVFESELLLDAILGTGFKPPVSGLYADAIRLLNTSSAPVLRSIYPRGPTPMSWANRLGGCAG